MTEQTKDMIIIRPAGEVSLKGKQAQEHLMRLLMKNICTVLTRREIEHSCVFKFKRLFLETTDPVKTCDVISHIFGIGSYSLIEKISSSESLEDIIKDGEAHFADSVKDKEFAVRTKKFGPCHYSRTEINIKLGSALNKYAKKVNLTKPEIEVFVEIIGPVTYFFTKRIKGAGGLPVNKKNHAFCLISGGFDSAVAAWQIMRRGVHVDFVFCNLGGQAYEHIVLHLTKTLCEKWDNGQNPRFISVKFDGVVSELKDKISDTYRQVILKRQMYRVGCQIARINHSNVIITGEVIGQVSSQTLKNLAAIEQAANLPVLRPLIGMDKEEIIAKAWHIGTASISEKVQEYCSIARGRPIIVSKPGKILAEEEGLDPDLLLQVIGDHKRLDIHNLNADDLKADYLFRESISDDAVVIDCQSKSAYQNWHIENAVHYPFDTLLENIKTLDKSKTHILYCTGGTQTPYFAEILQQQGFEAYAFKGGLAKVQKYIEQK